MATNILTQGSGIINFQNGIITLSITDSDAATLAQACRCAATGCDGGDKFRVWEMLFTSDSLVSAFQTNITPSVKQQTDVYIAGMLELVQGEGEAM